MVIRILTLALAILVFAGSAHAEISEIVETQEIVAVDEAVVVTITLAPPPIHPAPAESWRIDVPPSAAPTTEIFRPPRHLGA